MSRYAAIDVGTNSVLLLVAERGAAGRFAAVQERTEITRLGRGVDQTKRLAPEAIADTLAVLESYAKEARELGATDIVVSATSAARDAQNGPEFLAGAQQRAGLTVEIITGDEEARLSFASAWADFGGKGPLVVLDIGGGSTELIFGGATGQLDFRRSFDVGSVRLTERHLHADPPTAEELARLSVGLKDTFSALPPPPSGAHLVAVAGTATTICTVARAIEPYDAALVHGAVLSRQEVVHSVERLAALPVVLRRTVPGLPPRRADVIVAGGLVLEAAMDAVDAAEVTISDRGLRWGLLVDRFGTRA
ncbi:MAG: Ppx/GppA family phosphatase [Myxococcales bacterium]|nr:Ppx/GppA family phosphatase [Myxococcales bacterium]